MPHGTRKSSQKPLVLVFTTAYDPFVGGAEVAIRENVKRLSGTYDFFILTSRFDRIVPVEEIKDGATIVRLGFGKPWDKFLLPINAFFSGLMLILRHRGRPRILWAVMASYGSIAASTLKFFFPRTPYILTLQEGDTEEHLRRSRFYLVNIFGLRYSFRMCDFVTAISAYLLDVARRFNYEGSGDVIPNGVDVDNFCRKISEEELQRIRKHLGLSGAERIILTSSRLVRKNGIDTVIRALKRIKDKSPELPVRFVILGTGREAHALKDLSVSLGIRDDILFAGSVSHADLPIYLNLADVFVRPSRSEGFGNSFIEAMAAGLPVIGTPVGGIVDFLEDGKTGLCTNVDDPEDLSEKILSLLIEKTRSRKIASAARSSAVKKYNWARVARRLSEVFKTEIGLFSKPIMVVATGIFPPDIGGPATYSKTIAEELTRRNYKIKVIAYSDSQKISHSKNQNYTHVSNLNSKISNEHHYTVIRVSRKIPKGLRHTIYLWKCLKAGLVSDIFYAQDTVSAGIPALWASRILRKEFWVKVTGDYAWERGVSRFGVHDSIEAFQHRRYGVRVELLQFAERYVAWHARRVIVPSEYLKRLVVGWRAPEKKISVIYNSVEIADIQKEKGAARADLEIGADEEILVSVGRLVKWKGFSPLIDFFSELAPSRPRLKLVIIGDGPEKDALKTKIWQEEMEGRVILLGKLPREKMLEYVTAADMFILNTCYEGFSHQIIEVMGAGTPVISTAIGGNPEVLRDQENGILVAYNDKRAIKEAIERLLFDTVFAEKLGKNGRKTARDFTVERMMQELINELRVVRKSANS